MWTRDRVLSCVEIAGFAAVAASVALGGVAMGGWILGAVAGLFVTGAEAIYLANAYAEPEGGDHAER